jgi:4'-phosphopantetheinyl transferase
MTEAHTWEAPCASPVLEGGDVHVWKASLDVSERAIESLVRGLSPDEIERANRFHFERDRRRFIVGRGVLRRILGRYVRTDATTLQFAYSERGKPSLIQAGDVPPILFSISHSHELVLYAFARRNLLGIDVEFIRSMRDIDELAKRFFSEHESLLVQRASGIRKWEIFFAIWTVKEAYLKATGEGLAGLEDVEVTFSPDASACGITLKDQDDRAKQWTIRSMLPEAGYIAAVAVHNQVGTGMRFFETQPLV